MQNVVIGWNMGDLGDTTDSFRDGLVQVLTSASGRNKDYETDTDHIYIVTSKDRVDMLAGQGLCDVLICAEKLKDDNIGIGALRQWVRIGQVKKVILVLSDLKYGRGKVKGMYDSEFYDALFEKDFTGRNLVNLILNGRSEKQAYDYYGLKEYKDLFTNEEEPQKTVTESEEPPVEKSKKKKKNKQATVKEAPEEGSSYVDEVPIVTGAVLESETDIIKRQHEIGRSMYADKDSINTSKSVVNFLKAGVDVSDYIKAMEEAALTAPDMAGQLDEKGHVLEDLLIYYTQENPSWVRNLEQNISTRDQWNAELSLKIQSYDLAPDVQKQVYEEFNRFMFGYDFIEDFIKDPYVTDILINAPDAVQTKRKGLRRPQTHVFRSPEHLRAFVSHLAKRNHVNLQKNAQCKFMDTKSFDEARLRVNISTEYVTCSGYPCVQIRKENNTKYTTQYFIDAGTMTKETAAYLIYKAQTDTGMVFCGGNAQGKTSIFNWLIDYIPRDMTGLCIQESDELFSNYHRFLKFQQITEDEEGNIENGKGIYDLQQLTRTGLTTDNDYFMIGEIKGPEAAHFINAAFTGSRCWATVHAMEARAALPKIADYALKVTNYTKGDLLPMLTNLRVIVFIEKFQIKEIVEVVGYDAQKEELIYKNVPIVVPERPHDDDGDAAA